MTGRPQPDEFVEYYSKYIALVPGDDAPAAISQQLKEALPFLTNISQEKSLHRYAPGKWSIRELLNHVTDTERAFTYRALWFARGFDAPLLSYDQETAAAGAQADKISWSAHVEEFERVRLATLSLFANMPQEAWSRAGIVSGNRFTVRALAFIIPGHVTHHLNILRQRYL